MRKLKKEKVKMLINSMLREDTESCHEAIKRDLELCELEKYIGVRSKE